MRAFIKISCMVRNTYLIELPFIAEMCKRPQREDVSRLITKYLNYKLNEK